MQRDRPSPLWETAALGDAYNIRGKLLEKMVGAVEYENAGRRASSDGSRSRPFREG